HLDAACFLRDLKSLKICQNLTLVGICQGDFCIFVFMFPILLAIMSVAFHIAHLKMQKVWLTVICFASWRRMQAENFEANMAAVQRLRDFAAQKGCTPGQIALA